MRGVLKKRGLSEVVANLLIILLVLVAVGVIWVVIKNVIDQGAADIEIGRFTYDISIESAYVSGADVTVSVRRAVGGGSDLTGLNFIFTNSQESFVIKRTGFIQETARKTFTFNSTEIPGIEEGDEVSVAPVYVSGGAEKTTNPTDTAEIGGAISEGGTDFVCGNAICESSLGESASNCPADCTGPGGAICGNAICEATEDTISCNVDCAIPISCDGTWNQTDIDDENECDGNPLPANCQVNCMCEGGFGPSGSGSCNLDNPLNTGTISTVWHGIYFDSNDLDKSFLVTNYINDYVNFSGSPEARCFLITFADYLSDDNISYLRVDDSLGMPEISDGEGYSVWEAANCGQP